MLAQAVLTSLITFLVLAAAAFGVNLALPAIGPAPAVQPSGGPEAAAVGGSPLVCKSGTEACLLSYGGRDIDLYGDAGTTRKLSIDGATGGLTFADGAKLVWGSATNAGPVLAATNSVAYTNTTNKTMFVLPKNSEIVDITAVVQTVFNSSGTDQLSCGYTSGGPTEYVNALDVSATCVFRAGGTAAMKFDKLASIGTSNVTVLCKYAQGVADATTGAATVEMLYRIP
jgi:hypothetical protein